MQYLVKYEKYIFWLLVLLHLYPVLAFKLFPTLDGPAHLYNSNLINQVITGDPFVSQFFYANGAPDPNYTGHILLSIFNSVLPAWLAEKLLLVLIVTGLPLSFRMLLRALGSHTMFMDYLVFPFIYTFTFYLGFFNFTIGIILMFFTLSYWQKNHEWIRLKHAPVLIALMLLLYFSHLFTFLLTGFVIGWLIVWNNTSLLLTKAPLRNGKYFTKQQLKYLFIAALPGLLLTVYFLLQKGDDVEAQYLEKSELLEWLIVVRPLIALNFAEEEPYTRYVFYTFIALLLYIIVARIYNYIRAKNDPARIRRLIRFSDSWLLLCIMLLVMYFILPDWMASGGYISIRLALFFFMMLIVWIALQELNGYLKAAAILVFIAVSGCLHAYHYSLYEPVSEDAEELYAAAGHVESGSTVLPLDHSGNWFYSNFSNYMGTEKSGIVVLDNYEAAKPQFPLRWVKNKEPYDIIAPGFGDNSHPCIDIAKYEKHSGSRIDYVLRWYYNPQSTDSCDLHNKAQLDAG